MMCERIPCRRVNLPLPVVLKRFLAPEWVFIFGIRCSSVPVLVRGRPLRAHRLRLLPWALRPSAWRVLLAWPQAWRLGTALPWLRALLRALRPPRVLRRRAPRRRARTGRALLPAPRSDPAWWGATL